MISVVISLCLARVTHNTCYTSIYSILVGCARDCKALNSLTVPCTFSQVRRDFLTPEARFLKKISDNPDSGIWIHETNFLKKYKKLPSFFVLVLVCSRWQIYTKGGNVQNVINARAIMPIVRHKIKEN